MRHVAGLVLSVCLCAGAAPCMADVHPLRVQTSAFPTGQTPMPDAVPEVRMREPGNMALPDTTRAEGTQRVAQAPRAYAGATEYVSAPESGVPPSGRWLMLVSGIAIACFIAHLRSGPLRS